MGVITRAEAKTQGLAHYYTGKLCKHGHASERYTLNGDCCECAKRRCSTPGYREYKAQWYKDNRPRIIGEWRERYAANREKILERQNAYYHRNKSWILKQQYEHYIQNREEILEDRRAKYAALPQHERDEIQRKNREWRDKNPERYAEAKAKWLERNKEKVKARSAAHSRTRQAKKRKACPSWVNVDHIQAFYSLRQRVSDLTGVEHHVDHYYPLQGKTVCGLHVPWNLHVITADENIKKGNKMPEEFYGPNHTPPTGENQW